MSESRSPLAADPSAPRLESLEWLASGAHSGMLRVRGTRGVRPGATPGAPILVLRSRDDLHRYTTLRDDRAPDGSWRAAYVLATELLSRAGATWLEWPDGTRLELPAVETESEYATDESPVGTSPAGEVIDRAVIAERRAQRAESAQQAQARAAADALDGLVALERRLEQITAERDSLSARARELERRASTPVRLVEAGDELLPPPDSRIGEELEAARTVRLAAEQEAERQRDALVRVQDALAQVRRQTSELRLRLRTQSSSAAVNSVRVAVLESERASWEASLAAARAESVRTREHLTRVRRERELDPQALRSVHARVAGLKGQRDELRVALAVERRARERAEHDARARADELAVARDAAADLRRRLAGAEAERSTDVERLRARVDALAEALEAARGERSAAIADADAARLAERSARTELVAVADGAARAASERERRSRARALEARATALEERLSEQRAERSSLVAELERERRARRRALSEAREQRETAAEAREHASALAARVAELTDGIRSAGADPGTAGSHAEAARAETAQLRASVAALQEKLDRTRSALDARREPDPALRPDSDGGSELQRRIHALEAAPAARDLQARALEQARAAASVRPSEADAGRLAAELDAAAASLRAAVAVEDAPAPPRELDGASARAALVRAPASGIALTASAARAPGRVRLPFAAARTLSRLLRPAARVISHAPHPAPTAAPSSETTLREALVRVAHEDSFTAARMLASLLPAQGAFISTDIDYDVTITELGCFAVTVVDGRATVRALRRPRPRRQAELHVSADAVTLAELLAGRHPRVGRFRAPVRVRGSRDRFAVLVELGQSRATLGEVVRAGARLDPWLVMRALPHAVDSSWTAGHSFTVAQEITGSHPQTWYIEVAGRAGLSVSPIRPLRRPDARVSMPRGTFDRLLAGEAADPGMKPWVWGDFTAVERLRGWAERARA